MKLMSGNDWSTGPSRAGSQPSANAKALERIGSTLRSVYADLPAEPLPDRLELALRQLDRLDSPRPNR